MNPLEIKPSGKERALRILDIQKAKSTALEEKELEAIKDRQDTATRDFLAGKISAKEFNETMDRLDEQSGVLKFNSESQFRGALKQCGYSDAVVEEVVAHERSHFVYAAQIGATGYYQIQFFSVYKDGEVSFDAYPSVNVTFPKDMPDDKQRQLLRKIINSPHDMSPRDKAQST